MVILFLLSFHPITDSQFVYCFHIRWVTFPDSRYNWGDVNLPYLHIHGADVAEPVWPQLLKESFGPSVSFYAGLALVKFRAWKVLLEALRAVHGFDAFLLGTVVM